MLPSPDFSQPSAGTALRGTAGWPGSASPSPCPSLPAELHWPSRRPAGTGSKRCDRGTWDKRHVCCTPYMHMCVWHAELCLGFGFGAGVTPGGLHPLPTSCPAASPQLRPPRGNRCSLCTQTLVRRPRRRRARQPPPSPGGVRAAAVASCWEDAQGCRRCTRAWGAAQRWDHHLTAPHTLLPCIRVHCCLTVSGMRCRGLLWAAHGSADKFCPCSVHSPPASLISPCFTGGRP